MFLGKYCYFLCYKGLYFLITTCIYGTNLMVENNYGLLFKSECGKKNDNDAEFCNKCGNSLKKTDSEDVDYKKLYRSGKDKILGGICGGFAEYFKVDPLLVRIILIIGLFFSFGTIFFLYIILWIIILRNPNHEW